MPALLDKPTHRERTPARRCKTRGCRAWLTSANEDPYCWSCGGWSTQRLSAMEALPHASGNTGKRERVGAALEELMTA